ncbi:MAG: hypothetical protein LUH10_16050 [Tannerellaceae bacterium]|nr:hypothetical protein [Tannerellaceae bacterium]
MTIEELQKMATDLYRDAGDRLPETVADDKENWIAGQIGKAIQEKGPVFNQLKALHSREEVYNLLKKRYGEMNYGNPYDMDEYN